MFWKFEPRNMSIHSLQTLLSMPNLESKSNNAKNRKCFCLSVVIFERCWEGEQMDIMYPNWGLGLTHLISAGISVRLLFLAIPNLGVGIDIDITQTPYANHQDNLFHRFVMFVNVLFLLCLSTSTSLSPLTKSNFEKDTFWCFEL